MTILRGTFLASVLVLALVGCSSDSTPTDGGSTDTTPPKVTSVTPVDGSHIEVAFDENLWKETAEHRQNYVILEVTTARAASPAVPGDTLQVWGASLESDLKTVLLTTEPMSALPYELSVSGVKDTHGNAISAPVTGTFDGTTDPDVTPPAITYRSPSPNATGVGVGESVIVEFSEPVDYNSVVNGFTWTSTGGPVARQVQYNQTSFAFTPLQPLDTGTQYMVSLVGVQDFASNTMANTTWSFTTTLVHDTTPPTLVSSSPANHAAHVSVNTNLSLTFSEAINPNVFEGQITPNPGDGTMTWSNGGKTLTFDPDLPLASNQQYSVTFLPGGIQDLAGNGNVDIINIVFTTAASLASGSIAGTLSGDPSSSYASDPTGALVAAFNVFPFGQDEVSIISSDIVAANNTYSIPYLPDDVYYVVSVMNTNGDDEIDPSSGDAIGGYGLDISMGDFDPDSVTITSGNHATGKNFPLYDPSGISGTVSYSGAYAGGYYNVGVALFDTTGFDPTGQPDYATNAYWPDYVDWRFNTLDDGLADGTYYAGAYLDVNTNGTYDPGTDPVGLYGGDPPTPIHIENGSDAVGLVITMEDPAAPFVTSPSVVWPVQAHDRAPWFRRLAAAVREAQRVSKR
jgi:hypothetical protein